MLDRRLRNPVLLSILAAVATIALKYFAYHVSGSIGLLSDAAEAVVNLLAAFAALLSLHYSARPVDSNHTYGHEKIEYFSSGLEGLLIVLASGGIVWLAVQQLRAPSELGALDIGLGISLAASAINLGVARVLLRVARQTGSIILEADGKHLMSDVWTSAGILMGVALVWLTGIHVLDPVIALLVAGYLAWTGAELVWRAFDGLMDHALSKEEQEFVRAAIEANLGTDMDYHALRTRQGGSRRFADFHLLVPGSQSVQEAHAIANRIEDAVRAALPGIEVTVHIEPIEESESWSDSALLPIERAAREQREREKSERQDGENGVSASKGG